MAVMQMTMRSGARRHSAMARKKDPTSTAQLSLFAAVVAAEVAETTRPTQPAPVAVTPPPPPVATAPVAPLTECLDFDLVPDLVPDYIDFHRTSCHVDKHVKAIERQLRNCERVLGKPLLSMVKQDLKRYGAHLAERLHRKEIVAATVRKYQAAVRGFFAWAVDEEFLKADFARRAFQSPKLPKRLPKFLTEAELARLLTAAGYTAFPERDQALIALLAMCGLRISEALNSKFENFADGYVTVIGKNDKERRVPLPLALLPYLDAWKAAHPRGGTGYVFTNGTAPYERLQYDSNWRKYLPGIVKRAGFTKRVTSHALRHTYATTLLRSGEVPLDQIQVLLGHENISTTQTYAKTRIDGTTTAGINAAFTSQP